MVALTRNWDVFGELGAESSDGMGLDEGTRRRTILSIVFWRREKGEGGSKMNEGGIRRMMIGVEKTEWRGMFEAVCNVLCAVCLENSRTGVRRWPVRQLSCFRATRKMFPNARQPRDLRRVRLPVSLSPFER